jgi:hypothetical protein
MAFLGSSYVGVKKACPLKLGNGSAATTFDRRMDDREDRDDFVLSLLEEEYFGKTRLIVSTLLFLVRGFFMAKIDQFEFKLFFMAFFHEFQKARRAWPNG